MATFRGYANATRDELLEAVIVLYTFNIVGIGVATGDDAQRRVKQETLGHPGLEGDLHCKIHRQLKQAVESLTKKIFARLETKLEAFVPNHELTFLPAVLSKAEEQSSRPARDKVRKLPRKSSQAALAA